MRKISILVIALMMVFSASSAVAQTGIPGSGWWSGEQVQNVGSTLATVTVTAYDSTTAATYTAAQGIAAGAAFTFSPSHFAGMPAGFQGSAVVSSAEPIKAIVNVTNRLSGDLGIAGGKAAAQYQGIDSSMVATSLNFPVIKGGHFGKSTTVYIQNAGTSPATATLTFTMKNGDVHTYTTPTIGVYQMVAASVWDSTTFNPSGQPASWTGRLGALAITSAQPLAATVMEHFTAETVGTILQSTRAFTSADFDTVFYAPIIKNSWVNGRFTGINVMNVDTVPIDITVTYKGTGGTTCLGNIYYDKTFGVPPGAPYNFVQRTEDGTNLPVNCLAAAKIEATGKIVVVVTESYRSDAIPASGQSAVMSSGFPAHTATTKVSAPLFKDDNYQKRTGLQIQNVGPVTATNIVATFVCTGGASFTAISLPQTVASGSAVLFYKPSADPGKFTSTNPFVASNVNCGVTITSDQPIVALANESPIPPSAGGTLQQDNNNYEGFNLTP